MSGISNLTPTGQVILSHSEDILKLWSERARKEIKNTRNLKHPILINTLPAYINSLAEFLTSDFKMSGLEESIDISEEHGGERARLSNYDPSDLIKEYQIFRLALFEILQNQNHILQEAERMAINHFIDQSIRNAVSSFELVQLQIREQFIATLTHDLRNPLGAAAMAAELIIDELDNPKEIAFLVSKVRDNLKRANRMIQDLLDTNLVHTGARLNLEISKADVFEVLNEVTKDLSLIHGPRFIINGYSIFGFWDCNYLMRAFENLCSNAIKYGDSNSPITVSVKENHERVIVSVHNRGEPIPIEEQETIFQAYRRAHAARYGQQKGWGLGLPLIRAVAEAHGGSVGLTSTVEKGTTFTIDIPKDSRPYQNSPVMP